MVNAWLIGDCMTTGIKGTYSLCSGEIARHFSNLFYLYVNRIHIAPGF